MTRSIDSPQYGQSIDSLGSMGEGGSTIRLAWNCADAEK
jgi:hypothetical protein